MKPQWHFHPAKNWMNDPNGFCQVDGVYHLYYQYNPHGDQWGDIHWGHAVSEDLLHWQERPIAMAPYAEAGELHCFSGGACKDAQGRPHFFYTSIGAKEERRDCRFGAQQWFAEPVDGDLDHLRQRPGLTAELHGGMEVLEWRDPCVISHEGQYLMVLGGCVEERGCALLYTSPDMEKWTFRHILARSDSADGLSWECPNLIPVDGHFVLVYSPNGGLVMARVGTLDAELHFRTISEEVLDPAGSQGYYAPQCCTDEQGRALIIGWMPECDRRSKGWSGVMTLPRQMHVVGGRLRLTPIEGVEALASCEEIIRVEGEAELPDCDPAMLRFTFTTEALPISVTALASPDGAEKTVLSLSAAGELCCDLSESTTLAEADKRLICRRVALQPDENEWFTVIDHNALETMVNGQWLSARSYPQQEGSVGLRIRAAASLTVRLSR